MRTRTFSARLMAMPVIATCTQGARGNVNGGCLSWPMFKCFFNMPVAVLVGIRGGFLRSETFDDALEDGALGDVGDHKPACVYHDRGRLKVDGQFEFGYGRCRTQTGGSRTPSASSYETTEWIKGSSMISWRDWGVTIRPSWTPG